MENATWSKTFIPLIVVFTLLAVVLGLFGAVIGSFKASAGQILYFTWPPFFGAAALGCLVAALILRGKSLSLWGVPLEKGEASALVLAVVAGIGFLVALSVALYIRMNAIPNTGAESIAWTVGGCGIGIILGSISAPTFINWMFHRLGLAGGFIIFADLLLFAAGILLAVVFFRHGLLKDRPLLLIMVTGALLASPIGLVVSNKLLARKSK